jgi:hypothetical protein
MGLRDADVLVGWLAAATDCKAQPTVLSGLELPIRARHQHVLDRGFELHGCEFSGRPLLFHMSVRADSRLRRYSVENTPSAYYS